MLPRPRRSDCLRWLAVINGTKPLKNIFISTIGKKAFGKRMRKFWSKHATD
jgi:hypothetical protein